MKPVWFVQRTKREDGVGQRILYAAQEMGMEVHTGDHLPFDDDPDLKFLPNDRPVLFHGAISCVRAVQKRGLPYRPFAWFDFDKLCCQSYYAHWGEHLASPSYGFYPLNELRRLKTWLYEVYGQDGCVFLRPDTNDKLFTGEIIPWERFDAWMDWKWVDEPDVPKPHTLVVVATPVDIDREWRLFLADGRVVAGSQYMDGRCFSPDPHYPPEAVMFAEKVAAVWSPAPFYCMDVGLTANGCKVIECGSANCAGFYESDVKSIVDAMSRIAVRDY